MGLGIAIFIGILSFWGLKSIFDQKVATLSQKGPQVQYVVASSNLPLGSIITTDNVSQRNFPQEYSQSNAVSVSEFSQIEGLPLKVNLKPGDTLMYSMVDTKKDITKLIPPGHRAITIPVDDESSISSMLKPGDLIDLLITFNSTKPLTVPLIQGVKILATGKRLEGNDSSDNVGYANITLDVTAIDAKNITFAASLGKISAILRNPNDQTINDTSGFMKLVSDEKKISNLPLPVLPSTEKTEVIHKNTSNLNIFYGNQDE